MLLFVKTVFLHYFKSNTFEKGAALAYYTIFSFLPMIIIITSLLGIFFGEKAVSGEISNQLSDFVGRNGALEVENIIKSQHKNYNNWLTAIIGFTTLGLSATGMFNQIHTSFNTIWQVNTSSKNGFLTYVIKHLTSFSILIIIGFILLISTTLNSFLYKHSSALNNNISMLYFYEHLASLIVLTLLFAIMFRYLSSIKIYWKNVFIGGFVTSLLFIFGKYLIGIYIHHSNISSTFGSASLLALLMIWVYYTSQIIFLGASFVYILHKKKLHE